MAQIDRLRYIDRFALETGNDGAVRKQVEEFERSDFLFIQDFTYLSAGRNPPGAFSQTL